MYSLMVVSMLSGLAIFNSLASAHLTPINLISSTKVVRFWLILRNTKVQFLTPIWPHNCNVSFKGFAPLSGPL